jgi:hypothetical protein
MFYQPRRARLPNLHFLFPAELNVISGKISRWYYKKRLGAVLKGCILHLAQACLTIWRTGDAYFSVQCRTACEVLRRLFFFRIYKFYRTEILLEFSEKVLRLSGETVQVVGKARKCNATGVGLKK